MTKNIEKLAVDRLYEKVAWRNSFVNFCGNVFCKVGSKIFNNLVWNIGADPSVINSVLMKAPDDKNEMDRL